MHERTFDAVIRRAASIGNRRASLKALGAAALLATAAPGAASAGKAGKKARKKCKKQVNPCAERLREVCDPGNPNCLDNADLCCGFLRTCNAAAAFDCVVDRFII